VLTALRIDHELERRDEIYTLVVAPENETRARIELTEYESELADASRSAETRSPTRAGGPRDALGYWSVLAVFHALQTHRSLSLDWLGAGRADVQLIRAGEWWRAVTALTLHADGGHLLNNLVFGALFGVLLGAELGMGWAWASILLAGAAGNGINAWLHPPGHTFIGASTAVFSALGLLVSLQWKRYDPLRQHRLRRWAPPVIGAILLGYLGTSGARTDVLAHVAGIVTGGLLGAAYNLLPRLEPPKWRVQVAAGTAALLLLGAAWVLAFRGG
jgi:rhomboid protease GluP